MDSNSILIIKTEGRFLFLDWNKIDYISAESNYVRIHSGEKSYLVRETLRDICNRLANPPFMRISRSTIINVNCIKELRNRRSLSIEVVMNNNRICYWSRSYRPNLDNLLERMSVV